MKVEIKGNARKTFSELYSMLLGRISRKGKPIMLYQIQKGELSDTYKVTIQGTARQIERLCNYFDEEVPYSGAIRMSTYFKTKQAAYKAVNDLPKDFKVKTNISYVYKVNYWSIVDQEHFQDCRPEPIKEILQQELDKIEALINQTESHKFPITTKLITDNSWDDGDYIHKEWKIGSARIEYRKSPNPYFSFVKNKHKWSSIFS